MIKCRRDVAQDWSELLKGTIDGVEEALLQWYDEKHPQGLSWQFLGNKVGRSGTYISRIARGKCKPSFEVERDILAYIYRGREKEVFAYLEAKYPKKVTRLASLTSDLGEVLKFSKPSFYEVVCDRMLYHIYRLADSSRYTIQEISREIGCDASLRAKRLVELGCVKIRNDIVTRVDETQGQVNINFKATLQAFAHNLAVLGDRMDEAELGGSAFDSTQNKLLGLYETVNEKALYKAIDRVNACISDVRRELTKPESAGDIPIFINTSVGRFDTGDLAGGEK